MRRLTSRQRRERANCLAIASVAAVLGVAATACALVIWGLRLDAEPQAWTAGFAAMIVCASCSFAFAMWGAVQALCADTLPRY